MVGASVPAVLALHVEEGALGAAAAQRQGLLVVVEVVEGGGERGAAHDVHFIRLLHVPRHQADVVLADFLLLAGFLLVPVGVLGNSGGQRENEKLRAS